VVSAGNVCEQDMPSYVLSKQDISRASRKEWARAERKIKMRRRQELYILFLERIMAPHLGNIMLTHYDRIFASCTAGHDSSERPAPRGFCRNVSRSCVILELNIEAGPTAIRCGRAAVELP
jgi:hypothetical protein